jgi:hypothetical protein
VKLEGATGGGMVARRAHGCSKKVFEFCGNLGEVAQRSTPEVSRLLSPRPQWAFCI